MQVRKKKSMKTVIIIGLVAIAVVASTHLFSSRPIRSDSTVAAAQKGLPVVLTPARKILFEERIEVSGNVEAKNTALISARIPGVLDAIFVDEGDAVEKGQKLFQIDKIKLSRAMESAEQQVAVAAASVRARAATVERIEADLAKVQVDFERYKRLYKQNRAVAKSDLEAQESHLKQVQAALTEAEAGLELARAQEEQAKSNLAIARKDLADSLVVSPITGKVSQRLLEPGEMAEKKGTAVLRIVDLTILELSAYLPEEYYARVVEGETIVRAGSGSIDMGELTVTTKSPTIDPKLRTFEIKAVLRDPPNGIVPGARADIAVVLQKRTGLGIPRESVLWRGQERVFFTVIEGKAHMLSVATGLESDGWVEVQGDGLIPNMPIVRMGQERLNDGMAVVEVKEDVE